VRREPKAVNIPGGGGVTWDTIDLNEKAEALISEAVTNIDGSQLRQFNGFYALERIAQDDPHYRQRMADLLCYYLRTPVRIESPGGYGSPYGDTREQQQSRIAAQQILARHLRDTPYRTDGSAGQFWRGIRLDLANATLLDFDLSRCTLGAVSFKGKHSGPPADGGAVLTSGDVRD
jgi:hypothetical protein